MPRIPRSYDEIARHTVLEPDGSWRADPAPTEAELRFDRKLRETISELLITYGIDTVGFEVNRGRVILRGCAYDQASLTRLVRMIAKAVPEAVIDNRMRISEM